MATHSRILVWKIPRTEEPGGLHPWGRKESDTPEPQSTLRAVMELLSRKKSTPSPGPKNKSNKIALIK